MTEKPIEGSPPQTLFLHVLPIIWGCQQQHGLRHGDYLRYRSFCSRRIKHIRHALKITQQSHRRGFSSKPITAERVATIVDSRCLELLLMESERAWACAMILKDESQLEPRRKHHMFRRLTAALVTAEELHELSSKPFVPSADSAIQVAAVYDTRTELETRAYLSLQKARLLLERCNWTDAKESFTSARYIYQRLRDAVADEQKPIYSNQLESIDTGLSFCEYNAGDIAVGKSGIDTTHLADKIDKLVLESNKPVEEETITWIGRTVPIKNEKIRTFFKRLETIQAEIAAATEERSKIALIEDALEESRQAHYILKEDQSEKTTGGMSVIMFLLGYVTFLKLGQSVQKNVSLLCSTLETESTNQNNVGLLSLFLSSAQRIKPHLILRYIDNVLQLLDDILELPVLQISSAEDVIKEYKMRKLALKTIRCFQLARGYSFQNEWKSALALYVRSSKLLKESLEATSGYKLEHSWLIALQKSLKDEQFYAFTQTLVEQSSPTILEEKDSGQPIESELDKFVDCSGLAVGKKSLVKLPPDMLPVPCKPFFFDIASNHVTLPSGVEQKVKSQEQSGIGGYFKGWLWGSSK